jgi:phosphatidate cytidylyltransferase
MNQLDLYRPLVYYLFLIVFSFDAGAYIAGSLFGKNLIAPTITPKKTIEGFIGGYLSAIVIFVWALYDAQNHLPPRFVLAFTLLVCTIAFFGDLLESYLKRKANIKDSGDILPGHGGFLDRFDAVMLTVFFFFIWKDWLITFLK